MRRFAGCRQRDEIQSLRDIDQQEQSGRRLAVEVSSLLRRVGLCSGQSLSRLAGFPARCRDAFLEPLIRTLWLKSGLVKANSVL